MRKRIARHVANLYTLGDSAEEEWQWDLKQLRMTKAEQPDYSFRIRFRLPDREGLRIGSGIAPLFGPDGGLVAELRSAENGKAIAEAKTLVLRRAGLTTEQDARSAGRALLDPLARALSVHAIGADFGVRGPKGMFTEAGLKMVEAQQGRRVLNDFPGLMVFETSPPPLFVTQKPAYVRYPEEGGFHRYFRRAIEHNEAMTSRERVAFQLFSTSFFETSADTRLLTLMMAIEALVELAPRPDASVRHVEHLIALTEDSEELSASERDSILGSLSWLRTESIGQGGRRLASRLEPRTYDGQAPKQFFNWCYSLRSALAHGKTPLPTREEVDRVAASLERFVGHLLAGRLLEDLPVEPAGSEVVAGVSLSQDQHQTADDERDAIDQ